MDPHENERLNRSSGIKIGIICEGIKTPQIYVG